MERSTTSPLIELHWELEKMRRKYVMVVAENAALRERLEMKAGMRAM